ncbi:jg8086, partial [Pararge aegeria aegeria]
CVSKRSTSERPLPVALGTGDATRTFSAPALRFLHCQR